MALNMMDRVLKIVPEDSKSWNLKGNILFDMRNFNDAVYCFDQAIRFDSSSADFHYNRGNAMRSLNQYEEALLNFNEAIKKSLIFQ
jgi:tetratricopeptide (TPR) repeat protein